MCYAFTSLNKICLSMIQFIARFVPGPNFHFFTPHAQREWGKVIGCGVHIYIYIYMFVDEKKNLNRTLEIDSPFQTIAVGLLVEFID